MHMAVVQRRESDFEEIQRVPYLSRTVLYRPNLPHVRMGGYKISSVVEVFQETPLSVLRKLPHVFFGWQLVSAAPGSSRAL